MGLNNIYNSQTKTITFAAFLLAASKIVSSLLGLARDGLLAGYFGVWAETNPYLVAFRINDFFYNLFIVGGLAVAFLPLFSEYYSRNKEEAWKMVNYVLNAFSFLLILASLLIFIFAPLLIKIVAPGFSPEYKALAALLVRIMILSPILFGLSSIFAGVLQYFNRFLIYALAPILYNLGIVFGILVLIPHFGILGVGIGVVLGAFLHLLIQIPAALNCGFRYLPLFSFRFPAIKRIFYLAVPRLFAITSQQINLIVITAIASTIVGGVTIFSFANNLQHFPIGIVGISFAIAGFPVLSRNWALGKKKEFLENFSSIFRQILFLIIPVSLLLFILRAQLIRLIFGTLGPGNFDWQATKLTAASLGFFSFSIFASALIPFISRAFFSFQDTKTPTLIAVFSVALNIILSFYLVWLLSYPNLFQTFIINTFKLRGIEDISVIGLPLAFSLTAIFQLILLLVFYKRKLGDFKLDEIWRSFLKVFLSSILMGLTVYLALYLVANFVDMEKVWGVFIQTAIAGLSGIILYSAIALFFKFPELKTIMGSFKKQFKKEITTEEIEIS